MNNNKYYILQDPQGNTTTFFGKLLAIADPINPKASQVFANSEQPKQSPKMLATVQATKPKKAKAKGYTKQTYADKLAQGQAQDYWQQITLQAMARKGYNQTQLANHLQAHQSTINKWLQGHWQPNQKHCLQLLAIVNNKGGAN